MSTQGRNQPKPKAPANVAAVVEPAQAFAAQDAPVPTMVVASGDWPAKVPGADPARSAFIDAAAIACYSRHFHGGKAYQQAAALWDERKAWLRREAEAGR